MLIQVNLGRVSFRRGSSSWSTELATHLFRECWAILRPRLPRGSKGIAGVGLVFPRADRSIAEWVGYQVIRLHPIEGIEFVEEAVTALGYSTELATHLFGLYPARMTLG
jgi:hypothetical protein